MGVIYDILELFEENKISVLTKRCIYIYGSPGSGKTYFVREILKKLDYDEFEHIQQDSDILKIYIKPRDNITHIPSNGGDISDITL